MQRYVLSFGGETLIVRENAAKTDHGLTWGIASHVIVGLIVATLFFGGFFKTAFSESSRQSIAKVHSQIT
jgi:hypothetical protein